MREQNFPFSKDTGDGRVHTWQKNIYKIHHGFHIVTESLRQPGASLLVKAAFFFFMRLGFACCCFSLGTNSNESNCDWRFLWVYSSAHVVRNV